MAKGSNIHNVIIFRVDDDTADVVRVIEPHVLPFVPCVDRFEYARSGN